VAFQTSEQAFKRLADTVTLMKFHRTTKRVALTRRRNAFREDLSCLSWICDFFFFFFLMDLVMYDVRLP